MVKLNQSVILTLCCNLFHYYAFSVYVFSAVILSPIFFSTENVQLTKILGLVTISITLLLRPLGGIVFGHIGDRYGRKKALILSLMTITLVTTSIGFIPPYTSIGSLSSMLLIICLFIQGMCMGGQYTGAIIFVQEHTKKHHAAFACGLVIAFGVFGTLLGTATSFFFSYFNALGWEWRVPFFLTFFIGIALSYLMKRMQETTLFVESKGQTQTQTIPLISMIKNYKKELCASIAISSVPVSMFYLVTVYIPNFYFSQQNTGTQFDSLSLACIAQIFCVFFIPLFGLIGDRVGKGKQLKFTSVLLLTFPVFLFSYIALFNNFYAIILGVMVFSLIVSLYSGPGPAYLSERFPVIGRYSGMGLGIAIGEGLFGGISPIACATLERVFDSKIAPAYYVMFLGVISYIGILLSKKKNISLSKEEVWEGKESPLQAS